MALDPCRKKSAPKEWERIDLNALKAGGFIIQKQANFFSLRLKMPVENIPNERLVKVAEVAQRYGKGYVQ